MKKLYVVGLGPGDVRFMTEEAISVLDKVDVICGYTVYVNLVKDKWPEKQFLTTGMRKEKERCEAALKEADSGKTVAMVCSGDSGIYGMAGIIYELSPEYPEVEIEIVAGLTAASSGASVLGAPLTHDFAVISLSDLLTDWALIEKRLRCAAEGDFSIVLYNPMSKKRNDYVKKAVDIVEEFKSPDTVCGWVKNIGREGQECKIVTLDELKDENLDMFTTVFIGNANTKVINGKMVTPRGYKLD